MDNVKLFVRLVVLLCSTNIIKSSSVGFGLPSKRLHQSHWIGLCCIEHFFFFISFSFCTAANIFSFAINVNWMQFFMRLIQILLQHLSTSTNTITIENQKTSFVQRTEVAVITLLQWIYCAEKQRHREQSGSKLSEHSEYWLNYNVITVV